MECVLLLVGGEFTAAECRCYNRLLLSTLDARLWTPEVDFLEGGAAFEGEVADFLDVGRDLDAAQEGAGAEGVEANGANGVRYFQSAEGGAIREGSFADVTEGGGELDRFQSGAAVEGPIADFKDAFGDLEGAGGGIRAGDESVAGVVEKESVTDREKAVSRVHGDALEVSAAVEGAGAEDFEASREVDFAEVLATGETGVVDFVETFGEVHGFQMDAIAEGFGAEDATRACGGEFGFQEILPVRWLMGAGSRPGRLSSGSDWK